MSKQRDENETGPVNLKNLSQANKPAPHHSVNIRRSGCCVSVTFTTKAEYDSIQLYDALVESAVTGTLTLQIRARSVDRGVD